MVENDTNGPYIYFGGDLGRVSAHYEALRRQVPIRARSLGRQVHPVVGIVVFRVHDLGQTEVRDLDVTAHATVGQENISCKKKKEAKVE